MTTASPLQHLQQLLAAQRWREARPLLEALLAQRPGERALLHALCEAEIMDGAAERARQRLEALDREEDADAAFLHARALAGLDRDDEARGEMRALRARLPQVSANLELHLASLEQKRGDAAAAIECLRAAAAAAPGLAAPHLALASMLTARGDIAEACAALERAVAAAPADAGLRINLARAQAMLSRPDAALQSLDAAQAAGPGDASQWHAIAQMRAEHFQWERAREALAHATRLAPGDPGIESLASVVHQELGDMDAARAAVRRAGAHASDNLNLAIAQRLMLPQVYADAQDVRAWRARYAQGVADLAAELPRWLARADQVFALDRGNFLLAYQGEDDRELQRQYAGFVARLSAAAQPQLAQPVAPVWDGGRRLRVGFVSSFFRDCTIGRYFERWITALDPERFERFTYHAGALADDFTQRLAGSSEHFALLRSGSLAAAQRIRADGLDLLLYPEIGMDPIGTILASLRLAPVQLAAWGHPVTTGSAAIDHYVSVDKMEPADGEAHYVESLLRLPGPGVSYALPAPATVLARADFGLADGARIYACPQSLFKIHPDMDEAFAQIAERDPGGVLLFMQGGSAAITASFGERLQRALALHGVAPRGQVKFMPRMPAERFRALLGTADVVLDTWHWSGGNTSFDAFAMGVPVVALPGRFMRARQTGAMLQAMGLTELVTRDGHEYVERALEVARDREANAALRARILREREAIFERPEPLRAFAEALAAVAAAKR